MNLLRFWEDQHEKTAHLMKGSWLGLVITVTVLVPAPPWSPMSLSTRGYNGNILVNAFAAGMVKHDGATAGVAKGVGNPKVMFVVPKLSETVSMVPLWLQMFLTRTANKKRPTVRSAIRSKEKLLLEACLETFKEDLVVGIKDMGAAKV